MGDRSTIEWTDATWNPVTGCTKVSQGCDHCYAERITERSRLHELQGFDLACWCPPDLPCHADVLLRLLDEHDRGEVG